jgi:hypothetical protein
LTVIEQTDSLDVLTELKVSYQLIKVYVLLEVTENMAQETFKSVINTFEAQIFEV